MSFMALHKRASIVVLIGMSLVPFATFSASADDADTHVFWNDQYKAAPAASDPSTRVPESGRAVYQGDTDQTQAPATHHLKHHPRHQTQG